MRKATCGAWHAKNFFNWAFISRWENKNWYYKNC